MTQCHNVMVSALLHVKCWQSQTGHWRRNDRRVNMSSQSSFELHATTRVCFFLKPNQTQPCNCFCSIRFPAYPCVHPCGAHYKESLIHFLATPRLVAVKKAVFSLSTLASFIAPAPSFSLFEEANENSIDCVSKYPAKYSYFKGNGKRISKGPRVCICLFEADAVKSSWVKFHPDPAGSQMDWVKLSQEQIAQQI